MAIKRTNPNFAYGVGDALLRLAPLPIIADRDPTSADHAELGTEWINKAQGNVFVITRITNNGATWSTSPASGVGVFSEVQVTTGDLTVDLGNIVVTAGDLTVSAGTSTLNDVDIAGTLTFTGDLDLTSAALIDITSTLNAAPSIYIRANGGVNEQVLIRSDQGSSLTSISLLSDVGGIALEASGLADASALRFNAPAGGINADCALQLNLTSSQNASDAISINATAGGILIGATGAAGEDIVIVNTGGSLDFSSGESIADAVVIEASDAAGGVEIKAGSGGIAIGPEADCTSVDICDVAPTASREIILSGGTNATASVTDLVSIAPDGATTNADSVKQVDICPGTVTTGQSLVNINSGTAASGTSTVNISTNTGGGTKAVNVGNADALTTINLDGITNINTSVNANVNIATGTSTGVVSIGNGAAGAVSVDSAAGISIDGALASNFTVTGASEDLTLSSIGGSVFVSASEDVAGAVTLSASGGTSESILLNSTLGTAATSIDLVSDAGGITLTSNLATADGINLNAIGGGVDIDGALQVNIASAQAAVADSVRIVASAADGGVDIDAGTGGLALDSTGAVSIQGAAASDFSVSGAGIDLSLVSAAGRVIMNGEEAANDACEILSAAGGCTVDVALDVSIDSSGGNILVGAAAGDVSVDASGTVELNSSGGAISIGNDAVAQAINVGTGAAARTVTVGNTTGASAVNIDAGTGGINLSSGGIFTLDAVSNVIASPTASTTINANVGAATFTGFTTASSATQQFTITNSVATTTSQIICVASNEGANVARMTVTRINRSAGSFVVDVTNNGSAALNGNLTLTFIILN